MAQLMLRLVRIVATAMCLLMLSTYLRARIWSTISQMNQMMQLRRSSQILEAFPQWKQASKSSKGSFKKGLSDSSETLKSSKTMLLVCFLITSKGLLLMTMWLGHTSRMTLWILPLWAICPIGTFQVVGHGQSNHVRIECPSWMVVQELMLGVGIFLPLWRVDRWVIIWSFLERFWVTFWCWFIVLLHQSYWCMKGYV